MNKICVYTCITGNYDNLIEIKYKEKGIDYLAFTNNKNLKSKTWKVIYIEDNALTDVQLARKTKILGNEYTQKYDITIWLDGNQYFKKDIHSFLDKYVYTTDAYFISFKHHCRKCIYEEINACMQFKKESKEKLLKLKSFYKKKKYPHDVGLIESSIIIRKNGNHIVDETMKMWFDLLIKFTKRDQLTFNYCVYETNMPVSYIDLNLWDNDWTGYYNHLNKKSRLDSYRIYVGDSSHFELEKCFDGIYNKKNKGQSEIEIRLPIDTNRIEFEPSEKYLICIENWAINYPEISITYFNHIHLDEKHYFFDKPFIIFGGAWKKGDILKISLKLSEISDNEYQKIFRQYYFSLENIESKEKYIHDREKYIIGLDQELLKKETEIKESNKKIEEQKKIIFEKDKVILEKENEKESLKIQLQQREEELEICKQQLNKILNSKSWKYISKIRDFINHLKINN